jgi:hypothetical protein
MLSFSAAVVVSWACSLTGKNNLRLSESCVGHSLTQSI